MADEKLIYRNTVITVVEEVYEDEDSVFREMQLDDFVVPLPKLTEEGICLDLETYLPPNADKTDKGRFGQLIIHAILEYVTGCAVAAQGYHAGHDLLVQLPDGDIRVDVKLSSLHKVGKSDRWQFNLSGYLREGAEPGEGKVQVSPRKQRKDYTKSCDWIACVGMKRDGTFELFMIPSDAEEATKYKNHIPIPENWQTTRFAKWWVDTSTILVTANQMPD